MEQEKNIDKDRTLPRRLESVDAFRGFAIMSMILVNFLAFFDATPPFLKHARDQPITFADLVAPLFLFVLGMMYRKSIVRRVAADGRRKAYLLCIRRYLVILVLGIAGGCIGKMTLTLDWGILQAIGLASLFALPFMELSLSWRIVAAGSLCMIHQLAIIPFAHEAIAAADQGGPAATLAWTSLILLSSAAGDLLEADSPARSMKTIGLLGLVAITLGFVLLPFIPVSKALVTPSYILIATGISASVFVLFIAVTDRAQVRIPTLASLGRNALLIFLVHYALVRLGHSVISRSTELPLVLLSATLIYAVCYSLVWILDRKHLYLKV